MTENHPVNVSTAFAVSAVGENTRIAALGPAYLRPVQTGGSWASLRSSETIGAHISSLPWGASLALQGHGGNGETLATGMTGGSQDSHTLNCRDNIRSLV